VEAQLAKEAKEDAELRERHGATWNRPSSAALNSTLMEKIAGGACVHETLYPLLEREKQGGFFWGGTRVHLQSLCNNVSLSFPARSFVLRLLAGTVATEAVRAAERTV
jgi:hypothetical protein